MGVPQIIQVMNDHFSIETYGSYCDLGCLQVLCSSLLLLLVITILLLLLLFCLRLLLSLLPFLYINY